MLVSIEEKKQMLMKIISELCEEDRLEVITNVSDHKDEMRKFITINIIKDGKKYKELDEFFE